MDMTVPAYRAGTGPQPDPARHAARAAVDDLFRLHATPVTDDQPGGLEDRVRDAYRSAARIVQTLQRTSPDLAADSAPRARRRRLNAFVPIAAAAAVIVVIAASLAVPRLLTGPARNSPATGTQGSPLAPRFYPPFQVVLTVNDSNRESKLQVESAATGRVLSTLAPPGRARPGGMSPRPRTRRSSSWPPRARPRRTPRPGCTR